MDILIKNMKMPKDEYVDVRIFKDGRVIANQADANEPNSHYANFTAIAVPPHGDLKDENVIKDVVVKKLGIRSLDFLYEEERVIVKCVEQAPTVLGASDGTRA